MKPKKMRSLQRELFQCITLLITGLANYSAASWGVQIVLILLMALVAVVHTYQERRYDDLPLEEQRDINREERDERYLMIRDRASWLAWKVEDWLVWGAATISLLVPEWRALTPVLIWGLILRHLLHLVAHWWVSRNF